MADRDGDAGLEGCLISESLQGSPVLPLVPVMRLHLQ